jgi:type III secretion protein L
MNVPSHPGFVAVHRTADTSLSSPVWLAGPDELSASQSAVLLLHKLQALLDTRTVERDAAMDEGRAAGFAAGREEALREVAPKLSKAWRRAQADLEDRLAGLHARAADLACLIVDRIAAGLAPADVVAALALRAAQDLMPGSPATLRVHPELADAVRQQLLDTAEEGSPPPPKVRADPDLTLLDCRIELADGERLAGLGLQARNAARLLAQAQS